ncbi:N-acetylmuramoyl-L-alanine amidase [Olsenella sp. KH3B4]|uniref:N-acetylmuramoyl-L-alanine amidase n=1 Tax=Olsenella sp. KH3B4 TaxID=1855394 RepID=UPI0008CF6EFF|nr:N-acetylmuramoyl-L-alanine amidase [Olsenella sp. KH3B4]SES64409.1 N-acetylmuramoyl-L-alanine amidase [Olsenella sp. KH3B4]
MAKTKQRFSVLLLSSVALAIGVALALALAPSTAKAATTTYTTASPDGSLSSYSNMSQALSVAKQTGRTIAIDPGHGGWDSGANANGMKESDLTWKIANACKDYLESRGVTVYLTRGQYEYVSVAGRVQRAVKNNCCAIVSIHINAGGGRGAEVESTNSSSYNQDLYYAGQSLSALVLSGLQSTGLSIHGAGIITRDYPSGDSSSRYEDGSVADYYGITRYARKAGILGVIIEHGFIDGTSDAAKLSNDNYLASFGRADGAAIYNQFYSSNTWWSVSGINVSTTEAYVGETVTYSPKLMGVGENLAYNYVWAKPDWSSWGSTVKDTGSMTSSASGAFTPTKPGTYWLFVDVCSNGASKTTRMVTVNVKSGYGYRGVKVTTDMPVAGDAVTFSANVVGQTSGLKYNYVWSYEGSWAKGEWGSTVLSTGSDISSTTGSFTPTKAGTYNLYVDVVGPGGTRETKSTTVEVKSGYAYRGVTVSTASPVVGGPVNFSANVVGQTSGLTYNYVWSYEGSWAKGEWGSTVLSTGSDTTETSGSFTPSKAGTYTLYVDVVSAGGKRETRSTTVEVGVPTPILGSPQVTKAQLVKGLKAGLKARGVEFPADVYSEYGASTVEEFIDKLWDAAVAEGVRPEVIYAQSMVETGYLQFGGSVQPKQCNFCGLGATDRNTPGEDFSSYGSDAVYVGFLAQAQHLRAYAGYAPLSSKTYDKRYGTWLFGRSRSVECLSGTWASDTSYGNKIKSIMNKL